MSRIDIGIDTPEDALIRLQDIFDRLYVTQHQSDAREGLALVGYLLGIDWPADDEDGWP